MKRMKRKVNKKNNIREEEKVYTISKMILDNIKNDTN